MNTMQAQRTVIRGFTLIELLVAVAIIGVLMAIALPNYQAYIVRANRSDAQALLLEVVSRQEQYAASNRAYASTPTANDLSVLGMTVQGSVAVNYDITITLTSWELDPGNADPLQRKPMSGYTVTATPKVGGAQVVDGAMSVNQFGLRTPLGRW